MANLTRGQTFGVTETITNTKLHNLVDLGSISGIVDADIAVGANIQFSKILATGLDGSLLSGLPNIQSAAGKIPYANLNLPLGATYVSLVSIPNASLRPLTLASWVDAASFRNLASIPQNAGQFNYKSIVSSLASGSSVIFNGVSSFVGGSPGSLKLVSSTSFSGATSTGDISITNTKTYFVTLVITAFSGTDTLLLRFNNDSSTGYRYLWRGFDFAGTANNGASVADTSISVGPSLSAIASAFDYNGLFYIYPQSANGSQAIGVIGGKINATFSATGVTGTANWDGWWGNNASATSFKIITSGATMTGVLNLYEVSL